MSLPEREYRAPEPVGEPFRADPADSAPFSTESDTLPTARRADAWQAQEAYGHPPSHSPEYQQGVHPSGGETGPSFRQSSEVQRTMPPLTAEARFARIAFWTGIASIFVFNIVIGPIAVVMGALSIRKGEKRLGQLAMLFGALGTLIGIVLLILVAQGVLPTVDEMLKDLRNAR